MADIVSPTKDGLAWSLPWNAGWVTAVSWAGPDRIVAGNQDGDVLLWELPVKLGGLAPAPVRRLEGHTNQVTALAATPDGRWVISSSYDRTVRLWDLNAMPTGKATV